MVPPLKRARVYLPGDGLVPLAEATDFLESLVLFHERAPIADFECVVNLESLEEHQIATRHHPHKHLLAGGGASWLNYLYGERDNLWRLGIQVLSEGEVLSDVESCSDALNE
ncbi:hypothetical protein Dimus_004061 [Dionaea muscipula]